jgi:hypothetical protein
MDCPQSPAEPQRSLFARQTLETAQDDRLAQPLRQSRDLLVKNGANLVRRVLRRPLCEALGDLLINSLPPNCGRSSTPRDTAGNSMEPWTELTPLTDRAALPEKDEKSRLESVVCIMPVLQDSTTRAQDHRAVALDQNSERKLADVTVTGLVALEQLAVAQPADGSYFEKRVELVEQPAFLAWCHLRLVVSS